MTRRSLLHFDAFDPFKSWATTQGFRELPPTNPYEALRMRHPERGIMIVYRNDSATQHFTTHGTATQLVKEWLRTRDEK